MQNTNTRLHRGIQAALFILLVGGDQFTKHLAVQNLRGGAPYVVFPGILEFSYWENTGAAFSSFQGMNLLLAVVGLAAMVCIGVGLLRVPMQKRWLPLQYTMVLLLCGGLGNIIDRIARGFVVDFIYFVPVNFPTFNLADSYVTVSVAALLILVFFKYKGDEAFDVFKKKKQQD